MKYFFAIIFLFGSILIPIGLLFLSSYLAPPEFVLEREAVKHPDNLFSHYKFKKDFLKLPLGLQEWRIG